MKITRKAIEQVVKKKLYISRDAIAVTTYLSERKPELESDSIWMTYDNEGGYVPMVFVRQEVARMLGLPTLNQKHMAELDITIKVTTYDGEGHIILPHKKNENQKD